MPVKNPSNWAERSLVFVQATMRDFRNSPVKEALGNGAMEAARLSGASEMVLISKVDLNSIEILYSSSSSSIGYFIHPDFFYDHLDSHTIQLKESSHRDDHREVLFKDSNYILAIPLNEDDFEGQLILGFGTLPKEKKGLIEFAGVVQTIITEMMHLQSLTLSHKNSRRHFESLLHSFPESVVLIEENGQQAWVNQPAAELLSLSEGPNKPTEVSMAMVKLRSMTTNRKELEETMSPYFLKGGNPSNNWKWQFSKPSPMQLTVSCSPVNRGSARGLIWTFKNTTHHLETQKARLQIKELSELLSSVLNTSISGIMAFSAIRDANGKIIDFVCLLSNLTAKKLLKQTNIEWKDKYLLKLLPNSVKRNLFEQFVNVVECNEPLNTEHFYQWKGQITWFHTVALKLDDGFVVTFSDITDRKLSEERLIQSRAKLRAILENTSDFIYSVNRNYQFTTINSALQKKVYNETRVKLNIGDILPVRIFSELFFPSGRSLFERAFKGEQVMEETNIQYKGIETFYEFSLYPIEGEGGTVDEIAVFGHDITKRKAAQSEIRRKSQMLKGIVENMPVIIFRATEEGEFIELTGAGLKTLNLRNNQLVGKNALEYFPELAESLPNINKGEHKRVLIKKSKEEKPVVFEYYTFPDENSSKGIIGFAIDVTKQSQFEQDLKKAKETAEKASLAKSYFVANQSHEIRTPINAILGFAMLIKNNKWPEESEEYLDYIISSGQGLLNLLGNVLDLTKIEEGKLELVEEPFNFRDSVIANLHPYQFQAKEKGLSFSFDFDDKFPKYLLGDGGKINQIIINLVGNSIKFTESGTIHVSFSCMTEAVEGQKSIIKIAVSDTGIGVPKNKQKKIFQSFTQGDIHINRNFGGSGLGLSIVKKLVTLMGGKLGVKSPGELSDEYSCQGSTFWFTLPLVVAYPPGKDIEEEEVEYSHNEDIKVLLVDDNYLNQRLVSTMLKNLACKVTMVSNGQEALNELSKSDFDLVFMDVQMPVLNGFDTTVKIREELKLKLPIIGLSANVYKEDIDRCYESGMDDYLGRPYTIKNFEEKVFKWAPNIMVKKKLSSASTPFPPNKLTGLAFLQEVFGGDQELVTELVQDFLINQEIMLDELETALLHEDFPKVVSSAHKIRSSLQTVGLDSLYEALIDIENIARANNNGKLLHRRFYQVKEIFQKAIVELKDSLSEMERQ